MPTNSENSATAGRSRLRQAELASALGVSRQYVGKLVKKGVLDIGSDMRIGLEAARAALRNSSDLAKLPPDRGRPIDSVRAEAAGGVDHAPPEQPEQPAQPEETTMAPHLGTGKLVSFQAAKTVEANYRAAAARLEYERSVGRLLDRAAVERALHDAAAGTRAALDRIPDKLAAVLAAESAADIVHALLAAAIDDAIDDLAALGDTLIESLTATHQ